MQAHATYDRCTGGVYHRMVMRHSNFITLAVTRRSEEEINRSAFSYILGHLESMALEAACKVLEHNGFKPTSKIYDGCLATHNPDGDLDSTLRAAEAAVGVALGFPGLKLKEKSMYALAPFRNRGPLAPGTAQRLHHIRSGGTASRA